MLLFHLLHHDRSDDWTVVPGQRATVCTEWSMAWGTLVDWTACSPDLASVWGVIARPDGYHVGWWIPPTATGHSLLSWASWEAVIAHMQPTPPANRHGAWWVVPTRPGMLFVGHQGCGGVTDILCIPGQGGLDGTP